MARFPTKNVNDDFAAPPIDGRSPSAVPFPSFRTFTVGWPCHLLPRLRAVAHSTIYNMNCTAMPPLKYRGLEKQPEHASCLYNLGLGMEKVRRCFYCFQRRGGGWGGGRRRSKCARKWLLHTLRDLTVAEPHIVFEFFIFEPERYPVPVASDFMKRRRRNEIDYGAITMMILS